MTGRPDGRACGDIGKRQAVPPSRHGLSGGKPAFHGSSLLAGGGGGALETAGRVAGVFRCVDESPNDICTPCTPTAPMSVCLGQSSAGGVITDGGVIEVGLDFDYEQTTALCLFLFFPRFYVTRSILRNLPQGWKKRKCTKGD